MDESAFDHGLILPCSLALSLFLVHMPLALLFASFDLRLLRRTPGSLGYLPLPRVGSLRNLYINTVIIMFIVLHFTSRD